MPKSRILRRSGPGPGPAQHKEIAPAHPDPTLLDKVSSELVHSVPLTELPAAGIPGVEDGKHHLISRLHEKIFSIARLGPLLMLWIMARYCVENTETAPSTLVEFGIKSSTPQERLFYKKRSSKGAGRNFKKNR